MMHSDYDAFMCITVCMHSEEIKQMTALEKNEHAKLCDKNRGIKAKDLSRIATKMGCPEMKTTKYDRLQWIFVAYLKA